MASSVIKEFLVGLGFKTDEQALRNFEAGITKATKAVVGLAAAVEATAVGVAVGVAKFADGLERLYFASQKTGASATNLKTFGRALEETGASANEAINSVQGLARFLRMNPSGDGILASWFGVSVKDPKTGKQRDLVDVLLDIGQAMRQMPQWQAQRFGAEVGLSEDTIRGLQNGDPAVFAKLRESLAKAGFDKASKDAHGFMAALRSLGDQVEIFGTQIYEALQQKFHVSLESITRLLEQNGPAIAASLAEIGSKLIDQLNTVITWTIEHGPQITANVVAIFDSISAAIDRIKPVFAWLISTFDEWNQKSGGALEKIAAVALAAKLLGATEIIGGVLGLAGAFVKLGTGLAGAGAAAAGAGGRRRWPGSALQQARAQQLAGSARQPDRRRSLQSVPPERDCDTAADQPGPHPGAS